jgi:HTH-type transcriptional regulator / antitoxin HigA
MKIKPIKTEEDYQQALAQIEGIFHTQENTPEGDDLDVLVALVEAYERDRFPIPVPDPVEAIRYFLESRQLSRKELAEILGTESRVSEILHYKRGLSLKMIRNLHDELGIPAEILISDYDLKDSYDAA